MACGQSNCEGFKIGDRVTGKGILSKEIRTGVLIDLDSEEGMGMFNEPCALIKSENGTEYFVGAESLEHVAAQVIVAKGNEAIVFEPMSEGQQFTLSSKDGLKTLNDMFKSLDAVKQQYNKMIEQFKGCEEKLEKYEGIEKSLEKYDSIEKRIKEIEEKLKKIEECFE